MLPSSMGPMNLSFNKFSLVEKFCLKKYMSHLNIDIHYEFQWWIQTPEGGTTGVRPHNCDRLCFFVCHFVSECCKKKKKN